MASVVVLKIERGYLPAKSKSMRMTWSAPPCIQVLHPGASRAHATESSSAICPHYNRTQGEPCADPRRARSNCPPGLPLRHELGGIQPAISLHEQQNARNRHPAAHFHRGKPISISERVFVIDCRTPLIRFPDSAITGSRLPREPRLTIRIFTAHEKIAHIPCSPPCLSAFSAVRGLIFRPSRPSMLRESSPLRSAAARAFLCASAPLREDYVFQCLINRNLSLRALPQENVFRLSFVVFAFFVVNLLLFSAFLCVPLW